jgi:hypothetical protein
MAAIDDKTRATALFVSSALFRATLAGFVLLLLFALPVLFMTDQMYAIHSCLMDIPRAGYDELLFAFMGDMKLLILVVLLLPAIGIRWALKKA